MEIKPLDSDAHYSTIEVARLLGMAVRSVQLMVDRGELNAWKTPGGHRRISRASVEQWQRDHRQEPGRMAAAPPVDRPVAPPPGPAGSTDTAARVLLIEDSTHFQNLVSLLLKQGFPDVQLQVANDGIAGLAMVGQWQPDVLIIDILLPGIDGATLITSLRTHPQFKGSQLIVVTSLDEAQRAPYAFALEGVPVVHKPRLVAELPALLASCLPSPRPQPPSPASRIRKAP
jgi:excisionase family DNA binding protein